MGYVVGLGLQNPELKILFQSDIAEILNVEVQEINIFGNNFFFYFLHLHQCPVANMAANNPIKLSWTGFFARWSSYYV